MALICAVKQLDYRQRTAMAGLDPESQELIAVSLA